MNLEKKSRKLSFLLRHGPESAGLTMDEKGWVTVSSIKHVLQVNGEELKRIVEENDKKRFEFSEDGRNIRARQGHSFEVDLDLEDVTDLVKGTKLYHGTKNENVPSIKKNGLQKMKRQHVHLTKDIILARKRAGRNQTVLTIVSNGEKVWKSNNDVYLMESVSPSLITEFTTVW